MPTCQPAKFERYNLKMTIKIMKKNLSAFVFPILLSLILMPTKAMSTDVGGVLWRGATWATLGAIGYTNPFGADSFRMTFGGYPDHDALQLEANLRYNLGETMPFISSSSIRPFLDVSYSSWQFLKDDGLSMTNKGNAFGIAPGARFEWPTFAYIINFIDVRAGVSILAPDKLENKDGSVRNFGGNFTFSEQFAIGGFFSAKKRWEWQLGVQHHSNHNIYEQNNGIEFYNLTFGYNY